MLKLTHSTIDIAIVCSNFKESLQFDQHCLGLEIVMELEIPAEVARGAKLAPEGFRQVRLQAGNTLIKLMDIAFPLVSVSNQLNPGVRRLTFFDTANGQRSGTEKVNISVTTSIYVQDPDSILIEFVQV